MPQRQNNEQVAYAPLMGFESRKAAQICARFAVLAGGKIEKLKLIKLVYLAERKFLVENHHPMIFDELFSLPHGPICSATLNGIDGALHSKAWDEFIARNGNLVVAMKTFSRDDLDELSDAELETLDEIWGEFKGMTPSQIRNWTHENCPEYTETTGRLPIAYRDILEAENDPDAEAVDKEIARQRRLQSVLNR